MIPVYSISKPFTAQAVLELGISTDDAIGDHLQGLPPVFANRNIGELLNHNSGLADYGWLKDYHAAVEARERAWDRIDLLARTEHMDHNQPGFSYSNIGYLLLVMLIEQVTALPYFEAIKALVLDPLGITAFAAWTEPIPEIPGYDPGWVYSGTFLADPASVGPAVAKLAAHRQTTLGLSAGMTPVIYPDTGFEEPGYNWGFMGNGNPPTAVGHGGGGPGYGLMVLVNVATGEAALEYSTDQWNQTEAIGRLREKLGV